jgi:hypothetical protein
VQAYFRLHISISFGKGAPGSSQTVIVEIEGDALVPFGSNITFELLEVDDEVDVPLTDDVVAFELKLDTDPTVFAVPIG